MFVHDSRIRRLLRKRVRRHGTQLATARALGISSQYLNDVLRERREISDKLANALGFDRVIVFQRQARAALQKAGGQ